MTRRAAWALPVVAAALGLAWFKVVDFDVFWHLATGEAILDERRLVTTNRFSSLFPGHPWPNPEWLFQVVLAAAHRAGGWLGVQALKVLLVGALGVALHRLLMRRGLGPGTAAGFAVAVLAAMQHRFTERPQLFSYLFFAIALGLVERARRGAPRALWPLLPICALWSNVHPEVVLLLLVLGAVAAGELLNGALGGGTGESRGRAALFAGATLACAAATLLNPEGIGVVAFPLLHLFLGPAIEVTEYAPTTVAGDPLFWLALLGTLAVLAAGRRRDWAEIIPAAGLGLLGVLYQRDTPYFLMTAAVVLAGRVPSEERAGAWFTRRRAGLAAVLGASVALLWAFGLDRLQPYRWGWGVDERFYPVRAADVLLEHPWRGPIYNHYGEGGYLIHRLAPRLGVFQDGRVQAYPREFIARVNARFTPEAWPGIVRDYGVSVALVRAGEFGPTYFDPRAWGVAYWDDDWCLAVRRDSPDGALLARLEYRAFLPGVDYRGADNPAFLRRLAEEMERNQRERLHPSPELAAAIAAVRRRAASRDRGPAVP